MNNTACVEAAGSACLEATGRAPRPLQEFVVSRGVSLRVDRELGVIRGVKVLGLASRNGRVYRESALAAAAGLYEGAKVNVNHPKGHPQTPRDYQERIGVLRQARYEPGQGLFADLHFNPKHALAEQLAWDAEHAPENVGLSHNVEARVVRQGAGWEVEEITQVQSVDLVADPAATRGLYEAQGAEPRVEGDEAAAPSSEQSHRPHPDCGGDTALHESLQEERAVLERRLAALREELAQLQAERAAAQRQRLIDRLLTEHALPTAESGNSAVVDMAFLQQLRQAADDDTVRGLVEARAALVQAARGGEARGTSGRPRAVEQARGEFAAEQASYEGRLDGRSFARLLR